MLETLYQFVKEQLHNNQFAQGGAVVLIITTILVYLKSVPMYIFNKISRLLIYEVHIDKRQHELYYEFTRWIIENNSKKLRKVNAEFHYLDNANRTCKIVYTSMPDVFKIWYKGLPLFISVNRQQNTGSSYLEHMYLDSYSIYGIFAKKNINELLHNMVTEYNQKLLETSKTKVFVYRNLQFQQLRDKEFKDIENVIFENKNKKILCDEIDQWIKNKEWYNKRAITYKIGILLHGKPGNGKSSIIQAIAKKYNKDFCYCNIADFSSDAAFINFMDSVNNNSVLAIEDIDCAYNGREKTSDNINVEFNTLLNCLSGGISCENVIIFITTNNIAKLDTALIRDGRCDIRIEVDNPNKELVEEYLFKFYGEYIRIPDNYTADKCMATIQRICISNKNNIGGAIKGIMDSNVPAYEHISIPEAILV
jgi:AAA+ superfamily predicted ATPase